MLELFLDKGVEVIISSYIHNFTVGLVDSWYIFPHIRFGTPI